MASLVASQKFRANLKVEVWDHDPGTTNACLASPDGGTTIRYVDMKDHLKFAAIVAQAAITGSGVTKLEIVASDAVAFSNIVVIKDSGAIVLDALAEWHMESCTAEEIAQLATTYDLRYVAARITQQNAADEALVIYLAEPKHPHLNTTAADNTL